VSALWQRLRRLAVPPEGNLGRRPVLRLVGLLLVAGFAGVALANVDLSELVGTLASAKPEALLLAMAANVVSQWFHAGRWAAVVRPPGVRVRARDAFAPLVAGYAVGVAVPARAGDFVRAHLLARRTGLSTTSVLAAALLDYVVGTATLVPLIAALALATPLPAWARDALLAFAFVGGAGLAAVWLARPCAGHDASGRGLAGVWARLRAGLGAAHEPRALGKSFLWGIAGWGAELLVAWFSLAAVGLPTTLHVAGLLVVANTAANVISLSPGNAGPFEAAAALVVAGLGVGAAPALAFALLYHAAHLLPMFALGGIALLREAREGREPRAPLADVVDAVEVHEPRATGT
jgi:glycosyltransferase AglD